MREALRGLSVRGRAFLAGGATAVACAVLLDLRPLIQVGVLMLALPLLTALVVGRGRYHLALVRAVEPQVAEIGQPVRVSLTLTNQGWIPTGTLLLEEQLPFTLGSRPRFALERVGRGWHREVSYQVRSDVRGRFRLGPMSVRVTDPFGMVELGRSFRTSTDLMVTPRAVPLSPIEALGGEGGSGDSRPREFAVGSAEDVTVREYRQGDDLRRVHWRSSAHVGELMVRREEQPWQARATIVLDNRTAAHRGHGAGSSFETAVTMAASVAVHLVERGFTVRLVTTAGGSDARNWHTRAGAAGAAELLTELAVVELSRRRRIDPSWIGEQDATGLTIAVLGEIDPEDLGALRQIRHHAGAALAIAVDVDRWAHSPDRAQDGERVEERTGSLALLSQQGWRGATLAPGQSYDQAWQRLRHRAASPATPATTSGVGS